MRELKGLKEIEEEVWAYLYVLFNILRKRKNQGISSIPSSYIEKMQKTI